MSKSTYIVVPLLGLVAISLLESFEAEFSDQAYVISLLFFFYGSNIVYQFFKNQVIMFPTGEIESSDGTDSINNREIVNLRFYGLIVGISFLTISILFLFKAYET